MKKIRYIGTKPFKTDNVAGTGTTWHGNGDVQEVPDRAVPLLLAHPSVWESVGGGPRYMVVIGEGETAQPFNLDVMNDAEMKTLATMHNIKGVDRKLRGDDLRAAIALALEPKEHKPAQPAQPPQGAQVPQTDKPQG